MGEAVSGGAELPFVGRREERAAAVAVAGAGAGGEHVLLVEAPAGMGKTRLLDVAVASSAALVRRATGREGHVLEPLAVVQHLVGAAAVDPDGDVVDHVLEAIEALVASAGDAGVVFVVDDLQWCDDRSAVVLQAVARRAADLPVRLLAATRPAPRSAAVAGLVAACQEHGRIVRLRPLDESDVEALVDVDGRLTARAAAAAGGHPFLLAHIARTGADHVDADHLASAVPVSDDAAGLLRLAAHFASPFSPRELARLADRSVAGVVPLLDEALACGVLRGDDRDLDFSHDLWREAFAAGVPAALRSALHREVAALRLADGHSALAVSSHLVEAAGGVDDEVARWLAAAAREASRGDLQAGVTLALRAVDVAGAATRRAIEADLISYLAWSGRSDEAVQRARRLLVSVEDVELRCRIHTALALSLSMARNEEAAEEARAALETGQCTRAQDANLRVIVALERWIADPAATLEAARAAEAHARAQQVPTAVASALVAQIRGLDGLSRFEEMTPVAEEARRVVESLLATGDAPAGWSIWVLSTVAEVAMLTDRDDEAIEILSAVVNDRMGSSAGVVADALEALWSLHLRNGRWEAASEQAEAWDAIVGDHPDLGRGMSVTPHRRARRSALTAVARRAPDAGVLLERWASEAGSDLERAAILWSEGQLQFDRGDVVTAARSLGRSIELAAPRPDVRDFPRVLGTFVDAAVLLAVGVAAGADDLVVRARSSARLAARHNPGLPTARVLAALVTVPGPDPAVVRRELGAVTAAVRRLRMTRAAAMVVEASASPEAARSLWEDVASLEAALFAGGEGEGAIDGGAPPAGDAWSSLTPAELRVVQLVATGRSNGEIAGELYLSRYTVETHLKRVFRKVGVRNRAELAVAASQRGLVIA